MATSGEIDGNNVIVSGSTFARYRTDWQLASQNVGGNYSTINWQTYVDFFGCDAELDNGRTDASVGNVWYNGGRVYNYTGNFSNHTVGCASGTFNIGHNSDGTQSIAFSGSIAIYQSGTSSASGSWSLPTIPRYANITNFSSNSVTDTFFNLYISVDATCSQIQYSLNNGSTYTTIGGSFTSQTISVTNLASNTTYPCKVIVTRQDSGLTTTSGTINVTTSRQDGFISLL